MVEKLLMATGNKGKAAEVERMLGIPIVITDIEVDEVQSMDLGYVARRKAEEAFKKLGKPVVVDDVAVSIEALNGFPGPLVKFLLETIGVAGTLKLLENEQNRNVVVQSAVAYHDGKTVHVFVGEVKATLAFEERGEDGYGFDPIIIPQGQDQTYAEMGIEGKNKISHRAKAFGQFKEFLDSQKK